MTALDEFLKREEELLAKATPGIFYNVSGEFSVNRYGDEDATGNPRFSMSEEDSKFFANVRTSHEVALKMLKRVIQALDEDESLAGARALYDLEAMAKGVK